MSSFDLAIEDYLEDLRVARRCSPHTVSNYSRDLKAIARSALNREIKSWDSITGSDVRSIIAEQHREGIAGRSHCFFAGVRPGQQCCCRTGIRPTHDHCRRQSASHQGQKSRVPCLLLPVTSMPRARP